MTTQSSGVSRTPDSTTSPAGPTTKATLINPSPSAVTDINPETTIAGALPLTIHKLALADTDSLLIRAPSHLTREQLETLTAAMEYLIPETRFVVVTDDLSLSIIKGPLKTFAVFNGGVPC